MKKLFLATLLCSLSLSVCAADYSVKPKVTELTQTPSRVLLVGNSFMYYNCGVNSYISGLSKSLGIKLSTTMLNWRKEHLWEFPITVPMAARSNPTALAPHSNLLSKESFILEEGALF